MTAATVVVLLTLLLGIQPVTADLYLPALPTLQRDLGTSIAAAQLTQSALMISFGLGQLVCGPLSDRFGRRPVLLIGLALYTAASLAGAASHSITALIAWRILQGAAMAAAVTCARSIVRDLHEPQTGARVMSKALTGLGVIAVLSPIVGGLVLGAFGWHATLLTLAVFSAVTLGFVALRFEETVPRRDRDATRPASIVRNWIEVCSDPTFRAWALLSGCTFRCRRLLRRHGLRGAVGRGAVFSLAGGASTALLSLAGAHATVHPLTLCIGAFSVALAAVAWTLVQRHGEPSLRLPALVETQLA